MNRFSRNVALLSVFAVSVFVCLIGCSEPAPEESGPSYADLVTVYNAELQSLDRLERKREELMAKHEAALKPSTDPNELLDRAVEHAEKAQDLTSRLLESVSSAAEPTEEEIQKRAELTEQFERELAAIDEQIVEQKARVDRAREARDAAEATQT